MRKGMACGLVALSFGFLFVGSVALGQAHGKTENAFAGTWKGSAQNKPPEDSPTKEQTIIVAVEGDTVTVTFLDTLKDGKVVTSKISAPAAGGRITSIDPPEEAGSTAMMKKIHDRTYLLTTTMNGKLVLTQRATVSPDHKTMTVQESGVDPKSGAFKYKLVYDRQ